MRLLQLLQDAIPFVMPESVPSPKAELGMLKNVPVDELLSKFVHGTVQLVINITIALIVFYLGKFIINKLYNLTRRILLRRQVDSSLSSFVLSFVRIVLYFILIVTVIGILGIETSSFLAIFASAGVAIGMALSGTLQNFAGGVLILLLKPYRVGDYIETQGYAGTVKEIQIFHTLLVTPDNKAIIIPNGGLSTGSINNWSRESYRRVDWIVGISYGDSVDAARAAILKIFEGDCRIVDNSSEPDPEENDGKDCLPAEEENPHNQKPIHHSIFDFFHRKHRELQQKRQERIEKIEALAPAPPDRTPTVVVDSLGDSAVVLKARAWTRTKDYWAVYYDVIEQIYEQLPEAGVSFPFPQLDVHYIPTEKIKKSQYDKQMELSDPHIRGTET